MTKQVYQVLGTTTGRKLCMVFLGKNKDMLLSVFLNLPLRQSGCHIGPSECEQFHACLMLMKWWMYSKFFPIHYESWTVVLDMTLSFFN